MVKVYYAYAHDKTIDQVISKDCNFAVDEERKLIVTGVNQYVGLLSLKSGDVLAYLEKKGKNVSVRVILVQEGHIYAGYEDGEIIVWDIDTKQQINALDQHQATVTTICVQKEQQKMVSGSMDGTIIIWDLLSEQCVQIKSAHHNAITAISLTTIVYCGQPTPAIASIGKDGYFRLWTHQALCLGLTSCHATEALGMHMDEYTGIFYVCTNKEEMVQIHVDGRSEKVCSVGGRHRRKNFSRCLQVVVHEQHMYVLNNDKSMEVYQILGEKEAKQRMKRAASRRKKEDAEKDAEKDVEEYKIKFIEEKVLGYKVYHIAMGSQHIYLHTGSNIYRTTLHETQITTLTNGYGRTQQLEMEAGFLLQRTAMGVAIYNANNFTRLYGIPKKVSMCSCFGGGYAMMVGKEVEVWDLAKGEMMVRVEEEWEGCWVEKNRAVLWRGNQVGLYQVGKDKHNHIRIKHQGQKMMEDKVTYACYTHSMGKLVISLQNSHLHILYEDTLRPFLKLYGHKLPITTYDITSDDALLVTGSVDKDLRLWDLDYGQCVKTIFAHQQPLTSVVCIPDTHYILSAGKDGVIKFWDADTYQLIMMYNENLWEIKSICVSKNGEYIVGGGLDEGFRVWKQTSDQTIAADMEEEQREKFIIEDYAKEKLQQQQLKTKYEDLKHGEQIIQALENNDTLEVLIALLRKIPPANLQSTLSFLHAQHLRKLEQYLNIMVQANYHPELSYRVIHALHTGSFLAQQLRSAWKSLTTMIRQNQEGLKILLKNIREEKAFQL